MCFCSNGRTSVRRIVMEPSGRPSRIKGTLKTVWDPISLAYCRPRANSSPACCRSATWIGRMSIIDRPAIVERSSGICSPTGHPTSPRRIATRKASFSTITILANCASQRRAAFSATEASTGSTSLGELDMTYLRRRGLLLQRLAEISCPLAQLVQQPRVLDGNDGLGGEVLHQRDLFFTEWSHLPTRDGKDTDHLIVLQHRNGKICTSANHVDERNDARIPFKIGLVCGQVGNVNGLF